jgi:hypothetical protein
MDASVLIVTESGITLYWWEHWQMDNSAKFDTEGRYAMSGHQSFQRFAALAAIVSFLFAVISNVLQGIPVNFSSEVFTNPAFMLSVGPDGASLLRWGLILDMLGYYLPLLPVALFLQLWCGLRNPVWVQFFTVCGLGYILIGAGGAATLAAAHPPLITAYAQASTSQRVVLETVFTTLWNMVYGGLWNILGELLVGIWFFGIGWLLRSERRLFSVISMILGLAALLDSLGMILNVGALSMPGLLLYLGLAPIWALWLGIDLLRKPVLIR